MAWPIDPINLEVGLFIDGAWVDAVVTGDGVRLANPVAINHGRSDWASQVDPGRATFTLDNRDGRWSPDNPSSPYTGTYRRNIPCRVGIGRGTVHLASTGVSNDLVSTPDIAGTGGGSPTAPAHVDVTESAETVHTTSHGVDMPATVTAGDRLTLAVTFGHENYTAPTELDDWALAVASNLYTPWNGWAIYISDVLSTAEAAALAGATVTFATTNNTRSSSQVIRTSGCRAGGEGTAWDIEFTTKTSSDSPNPPSLTTSWGADEHRWYALAIYGSAGETVSAYPTSYTSVADGNVASLVQIGSAHHTTSAATEDPTAFTLTATENWQGVTLAFRAIEDTGGDGVLDIAGDIDLRVEFELAQDPPALAADGSGIRYHLARKRDYAADNGFNLDLYIANSGELVAALVWVDTSSVWKSVTTEQTGAALPLSFLHDHAAIRVDLDVDNGASGHDVDFYTSDAIDGTWTQLGSTVTVAGTTDIKTNDAPLTLGGTSDNPTSYPVSRIFAFEMRDGGGTGTVVANPDFTAQGQTEYRYQADGLFRLLQDLGATAWYDARDIDTDNFVTTADHYQRDPLFGLLKELGATAWYDAGDISSNTFVDDAGRTWTIGPGGRLSDMLWRFHGELASLPVRWNVDGSDVTSPVEANGLFRRLRQGRRRLDSAIRRAIIRDAVSVVAYWPLEETGATVSSFGAAVGTKPMTVADGYPNTAANNTFLASAPLPTLGDAQITGFTDPHTATGAWQVRWLQEVPTDFVAGTEITFFGVFTSDIDWFLNFRDDAGGQLRVLGARGATTVYTGTWTSFNATGAAFRMTLSVTQNGSDVDVLLLGQEQDEPMGGGVDVTAAVAGSAGTVTAININGGFNVGDWAFGHVTVQTAETLSSELATELDAHDGERAGLRIQRLLTEEGIAYRIEGDPADTEQMGPQRPATLMDLLEECAKTDLGILHEARDSVAVGYRTRASMIDQAVVIDLDYAAGEVAEPPALDRDDHDFANDVEVKNKDGATARAVLDDGTALSVSEPPTGAGRYDSSFDVNSQVARLQALADTRLALSTVDEPRVSRLSLALHHPALVDDAALTTAILDASLGDRVEVSNNLTEALGTSTIDQIIQGTREQIGNFTHTLGALTTPYAPWVTGGGVEAPPEPHSVSFRSQLELATFGTPPHVLTALGYTSTTKIARSDLDGILDDWVASTGGTTRNVTSTATWTTACAAALPGDLIRVTTGFDPGGALELRGTRYSISHVGSNGRLTASPAGGTADLPIIVTCADGEVVDDNNTSSNVGVLDIMNCEHVWAVGFNVEGGQHGIRCYNWGGSVTNPAYVAYNTVQSVGHSGIHVLGWSQLITSSGGTPPSGAGNTWGLSQYGVVEENTIDGTGLIADASGQSINLGIGAAPGWVSYCKDLWVRGNTVSDMTAEAFAAQPGCSNIYWTDNEASIGYAVSVPVGLCYVAAAYDVRPAFFDADPNIWFEGNRVYNMNVTSASGSAVDIMGYIGLSGMRIANNIFWTWPQTGTHAAWRARNEHGTNDTEALTYFRNDPTWVINNTLWGDDSFENAGYGASPTVFPGTIDFDLRNNIVDQASPATGEVDAAAADFIDTVPAVGVAGTAEWETYGLGSAFDLALTSTLIVSGADISDVSFLISDDISQRMIDKAAPNPGAFQPHPANETETGTPANPPTPPMPQFYGPDYRPTPPTPLDTVATTTATFAANIAAAAPGDRLELATGSYGEWDITGTGLNGTAANPIIITPAAGATVTFTEIDIRENCSHVWFGNFQGEAEHTGFVIDRAGGGGACLRVGWDQQRSGTHDHESINDLKFCGMHITNVGLNNVVIKGGADNIDIVNCRLTLGGVTDPDRGEMIYIGQANPASYPSASENILIQGNIFEDVTADAVDIKSSDNQGIDVLDNYFEVAALDGTLSGFTNGIVAAVEILTQQTRDPKIRVMRNTFRDITETGTNARARAITTWMPMEIGYNIIFRTDRESMRLKQTLSTLPAWWTVDVKFDVHHNTCFDHNQAAGGYDNIHFEAFDTVDAARLRFVSNVTEGAVTLPSGTGENSDNHSAAISDFVGPTTGSADAGDHVGSGYKLASGSSIPGTAGALGKVE